MPTLTRSVILTSDCQLPVAITGVTIAGDQEFQLTEGSVSALSGATLLPGDSLEIPVDFIWKVTDPPTVREYSAAVTVELDNGQSLTADVTASAVICNPVPPCDVEPPCDPIDFTFTLTDNAPPQATINDVVNEPASWDPDTCRYYAELDVTVHGGKDSEGTDHTGEDWPLNLPVAVEFNTKLRVWQAAFTYRGATWWSDSVFTEKDGPQQNYTWSFKTEGYAGAGEYPASANLRAKCAAENDCCVTKDGAQLQVTITGHTDPYVNGDHVLTISVADTGASATASLNETKNGKAYTYTVQSQSEDNKGNPACWVSVVQVRRDGVLVFDWTAIGTLNPGMKDATSGAVIGTLGDSLSSGKAKATVSCKILTSGCPQGAGTFVSAVFSSVVKCTKAPTDLVNLNSTFQLSWSIATTAWEKTWTPTGTTDVYFLRFTPGGDLTFTVTRAGVTHTLFSGQADTPPTTDLPAEIANLRTCTDATSWAEKGKSVVSCGSSDPSCRLDPSVPWSNWAGTVTTPYAVGSLKYAIDKLPVGNYTISVQPQANGALSGNRGDASINRSTTIFNPGVDGAFFSAADIVAERVKVAGTFAVSAAGSASELKAPGCADIAIVYTTFANNFTYRLIITKI